MQADAIPDVAPHGLAPMQCHLDVLVTPSQGQVLKLMVGGPVWPNWDAAGSARHRREGDLADSRPDPMPSEETLDGDYVWGGQLIPHFGHLVVEQTTRLAQSADERPGERALFILQRNMPEAKVPPYIWSVLDWFGYPADRRRIVTRPVTVGRLWVAEQAEMLGDIPPSEAYLALLDRMAAAHGLRAVPSDLVYVSRAKLTSPQAGRLLGESYLCEALGALGVAVCYPETLSLRDQLAVYAGAAHLIFAEGSALHGRQLLGRIDQKISVLNRRPGWRTGVGALQARAGSVSYHDVCPQILTPTTTEGVAAAALSASFFDVPHLHRTFAEAGVDLGRVWKDAEFERQVDEDLAQWLTASFSDSIAPLDLDLSAAQIDGHLQAMGKKPLDLWLAGVRRGARQKPGKPLVQA